MRYDVIVVGAGPAGSTAARECASRGLSVLLLDKAEFPRDKPCGGGVTVRAARLLPFDLAPVTERTISSVQFSLRQTGAFTRQASQPLTYLTQRRHLDRLLLERATNAGVVLRQRAPVRAIEREAAHVVVRAGGEAFVGRTLVAADGANGQTARLAGVNVRRRMTIALEGNIAPSDSAGFPPRWEGTLGFYLGTLPGGYGWIFPKGDHLNVGAWGATHVGPRLRGALDRVARYYGFDPAGLRGLRGHHLPVRQPGAPLVDGQMLLVGDAAGLLDPFTGEGIYGAIWSGRIAAAHLAAYLGNHAPDLRGYARQVGCEFLPELRAASQLADLFHLIPATYMRLGRYTPFSWRLICRLSRGEQTYLDLRRALGPLALGLDLASDLLGATPWLQRRAGLHDVPVPARFFRRGVRHHHTPT